MSERAVHATLRVRPGEGCPLRHVMSAHQVHRLVAATDDGPPQVVVAGARSEVEEAARLEPLVESAETVVCRLSGQDGAVPADRCGADRCLTEGLCWLPVAPYNRSVEETSVGLSFAVTEAELRDCKAAIEDAGLETSLDQLSEQSPEGPPDTVVVDRGLLTPRQREAARLAIERGYSAPDPPAAAELAEELGIEKSTFSEHMSAVRRKVGDQLFPDEEP